MSASPRERLIHLRDALVWRVHRILGDRVVYGSLLKAAWCVRRALKRTIFIGVAGSVGKTTTKELLLSMLSHKDRAVGNRSSFNNIEEIAKPMLKLWPPYRYFVSEVSEDRPGALDRPLALLRPSIGIVTVIGNDHWSAFQSREAIAAEVSKLVASLPANGTAVLNADDELVLAMAKSCAGKVITYGHSPAAEIRAEDVRGAWPERLEMTVVRGVQRVHVRTQFCGTHWVPSVLAAIGGGVAASLTLDECAQAIAAVPPFEGRMQPVTTADGVTFIRDDWKAPLWTTDSSFQFMSAAPAERKIVVIGTLSDFERNIEANYRRVARRAQQVADITIFVGQWASSVLKVRAPDRPEALHAFSHVRDAAEYLALIARKGDLILLKGTNKQDHLYRIVLARGGNVACWRDDCLRYVFCNDCPDRIKPSGPALVPQTGVSSGAPSVPMNSDRHKVGPTEQVIIGLGNPEPKYSGTPHNVGYDVVDRVVDSLCLSWDTYADAWVARGTARGQILSLIKMRVAMNSTGRALKALSQSMSFGPEQCVLVHDDLELPLGSVRTRLRGGAGGHRGVASILEAFQTDAIRRVKIGVGTAEARVNRIEYVLTAFPAMHRTAVDQSLSVAESQVLEMVSCGRAESGESAGLATRAPAGTS